MKRKFGGYTVTVNNLGKKIRSDGLIETRTQIVDDIEIGVAIERMTWREDWLRDLYFGKDSWKRYRLINVENHWRGDINEVIAVWEEKPT